MLSARLNKLAGDVNILSNKNAFLVKGVPSIQHEDHKTFKIDWIFFFFVWS